MAARKKWWSEFCRIEFIVGVIIVLVFVYLVWKFRDVKKFKKLKIKFDVDSSYIQTKKKKRNGRETTSKTEIATQSILKRIFPHHCFDKIRPDWLKFPDTGKNLELDLYCPNLKSNLGTGVSFEINGIQHYRYSPHFHRSEEDFQKQLARDRYKTRICREKGIVLIEVPYTVTPGDLEDFIRNALSRHGVL